MDPFTLALAGLNLAGAGYQYRENSMLNRAQTRLGRDQANAEVRAAENARAQMMEDNARRKRMLQESLAARGVEDSTIASDDLNYLNRGTGRQEQGASDRVNLAHRGRQMVNRQARSRRRGNYVNLGLGLANALGGAYSAFGAAPDMGAGLSAVNRGAGYGANMLGGIF